MSEDILRITFTFLAAFVLLLGTATAGLAQTPSLNWGSEVNPSKCPTDQGYRYLEINVTRKVELNTAPGVGNHDLGVPPAPTAGDGWALREFNQHIQVWKVGVVGEQERFCALVRYQGSFTSTGSSNPNGGTGLGALVDGTFEGGYRLVFDADENFVGPTRGHVETVPVSTSSTDWMPSYFVNVGAGTTPEWWGWVYHGGHNGTWVNAIGVGNPQGNISGNP
jgi:hypothetical protein